MLKALRRWFLYVPPEKERPIATRVVRFWVYYGYRQDEVESYLFFKVWLLSLILNVGVLATLFAQYALEFDLNLLLFRISYLEGSPYKAIQFLYPILIMPAIIAVSLVYSILLFRKRSSLLHFVPSESAKVSIGNPTDTGKWYHHLGIGIVSTIAVMSMCALPLFISSYHDSSPLFPDFNHPSISVLLLLAVFYFAAFQAGISAIIHAYIYAIHLFIRNYI